MTPVKRTLQVSKRPEFTTQEGGSCCSCFAGAGYLLLSPPPVPNNSSLSPTTLLLLLLLNYAGVVGVGCCGCGLPAAEPPRAAAAAAGGAAAVECVAGGARSCSSDRCGAGVSACLLAFLLARVLQQAQVRQPHNHCFGSTTLHISLLRCWYHNRANLKLHMLHAVRHEC
jgi:hypothetical protein